MSKKGAKCLIISNHKHVHALYYANFVFFVFKLYWYGYKASLFDHSSWYYYDRNG